MITRTYIYLLFVISFFSHANTSTALGENRSKKNFFSALRTVIAPKRAGTSLVNEDDTLATNANFKIEHPYNFTDPTGEEFYLSVYQGKSNTERKEMRNEILFYFLTYCDEAFYKGVSRDYAFNSIRNSTPVVTSLAAVLVGAESTSRVLTGVSGLMATDNFLSNKDLFGYSHKEIVKKAEELRKNHRDHIRGKLNECSSEYTLVKAELDIARYWNCGTTLEVMRAFERESSIEAATTAAFVKDKALMEEFSGSEEDLEKLIEKGVERALKVIEADYASSNVLTN